MSDEPFVPGQSLGFVVNQAARLLAHEIGHRLASLDVTPGEFAPLLVLLNQGEMSQATLRDAVDIEQPTLTRTLQRMERDGLIRRRRSPEDARVSLVSASPQILRRRGALVAAARHTNDLATAGFDPDQIDELMSLLGRVIANLRSADPSTS